MLRGLLGGVGGAIVATLIYELAGGLLFPLSLVDRPISVTSGTRLLARLLVALLVAAVAAWAASRQGEAAGKVPQGSAEC
jgi:hypothetical protein